MKKIIVIILFFIAFQNFAQTSTKEKDVEAILKVLDQQKDAWNNYDLEGFMQGYWKSDHLKFFGKNGVTMGFENTLNNYKQSYPTKAHTGQLNFKIINVSPITDGAYYVMGEFHLTRAVGNADGVFMIIFKKINGQWKIIADTSC